MSTDFFSKWIKTRQGQVKAAFIQSMSYLDKLNLFYKVCFWETLLPKSCWLLHLNFLKYRDSCHHIPLHSLLIFSMSASIVFLGNIYWKYRKQCSWKVISHGSNAQVVLCINSWKTLCKCECTWILGWEWSDIESDYNLKICTWITEKDE